MVGDLRMSYPGVIIRGVVLSNDSRHARYRICEKRTHSNGDDPSRHTDRTCRYGLPKRCRSRRADDAADTLAFGEGTGNDWSYHRVKTLRGRDARATATGPKRPASAYQGLSAQREVLVMRKIVKVTPYVGTEMYLELTEEPVYDKTGLLVTLTGYELRTNLTRKPKYVTVGGAEEAPMTVTVKAWTRSVTEVR